MRQDKASDKMLKLIEAIQSINQLPAFSERGIELLRACQLADFVISTGNEKAHEYRKGLDVKKLVEEWGGNDADTNVLLGITALMESPPVNPCQQSSQATPTGPSGPPQPQPLLPANAMLIPAIPV